MHCTSGNPLPDATALENLKTAVFTDRALGWTVCSANHIIATWNRFRNWAQLAATFMSACSM